jgi:hypothetical protein
MKASEIADSQIIERMHAVTEEKSMGKKEAEHKLKKSKKGFKIRRKWKLSDKKPKTN